jgi:hypothetical protein
MILKKATVMKMTAFKAHPMISSNARFVLTLSKHQSNAVAAKLCSATYAFRDGRE